MTKFVPSKKRPRIQLYLVYGGLGLSLCTEMVIFGGIGWWLGGIADKKWGTTPWGVIVGILLCISLSLFHVLRVVTRIQERLESEDAEDISRGA